MPLLERLPLGDATAQWSRWSTTVRLVVADPSVLGTAREVVEAELDLVEAAASRFHDSELARLRPGARQRISPLLRHLLEEALRAAERTGGDVDPALGGPLGALGYDRDLDEVVLRAPRGDYAIPARTVQRVPFSWRDVELHPADDGGAELLLPPGLLLDLGATAKACAADLAAARIATTCGTGVLLALGGDVATAGEPVEGGWSVLVQDGEHEPAAVVTLPEGAAVASSSTRSRRWRHGTRELHHILDPRTLLPAEPYWRTVSVVADSTVAANTASTAAIVRGAAALDAFARAGTTARLVDRSGAVHLTGGWPASGEQHDGEVRVVRDER
ncbi:FAD:protein FMN transferase [Kineococcus gynurae]|uniref:FAD:protein FMN transferase n=1 Tax=Kineococcus gynurae TaxID=452979 RepID=A0ABV5LP79_9ACTN